MSLSKETKWTDEQREAIEARNCNLLVAAAAGSGKTAVLVQRILSIITDESRPVDIDKLLVVTFTNAAASEMRERIGDAISKALDEKPESDVLQRQMVLLNKSNIETMHAFCLNVIKNNVHLLDIDPSYRISDGTEAELLRQEAILELFESKYKEDKYFPQLVEYFGDNRSDIKLQNVVLDVYRFVMSSPWPEKWLDEMTEDFNAGDNFSFDDSKWFQILKKYLRIQLKNIEEDIDNGIRICEENNLMGYLETLNSYKLNTTELLDVCGGSYEKIYDTFRAMTMKALKSNGKGMNESAEDRVKDIKTLIKKKYDNLSESLFVQSPDEIESSMKKMYPVMLSLKNTVLEFDRLYSEKKRERNIIDFNDMEHFCIKILSSVNEDGDIVPSEVALKYRDKFEEILVDEYQDSNNVQETILKLISRQDSHVPNLFMVGDVKQSIYRFRQADPGLFLAKYNSYSLKKGDRNRKILLYKNFRSRKGILDSINYIFRQIMSYDIGELDYNHEESLNYGADYPEHDMADVELNILDTKVSEESSHSEDEEEEDINNTRLEARMTAKIIQNLINDKENKHFEVYDRGTKTYRAVQYRDIVILLRSKKDKARYYSEELGNLGIPVFADAGSGYFDTLEVRTIISLLQIIDNPHQDIPLVAVMRSPIFSFTNEELIEIRLKDTKTDFYGAVELTTKEDGETDEKTREKLISFINTLEKWREEALYLPMDELIWKLLKDTSYYSFAGAMPNGMQRQANLRYLFERARDFEETSYKGLFNFMNFINRLKKSGDDLDIAKIIGENENVVRIMSIHKSKGLEFPVAILSDAGKRFNAQDKKMNLYLHKDLGFGPKLVDYEKRTESDTVIRNIDYKKIELENLSEEMRILYVAMTRAKEKLIITGTVKDIDATFRKWCSSVLTADKSSKLPSGIVLEGKSYLDWIGYALARHEDCSKIRDAYEENSIPEDSIVQDKSRWNITAWKREELLHKPEEEGDDHKSVYEIIESKEKGSEKTSYSDEINGRLNWEYVFKASTTLPSKISVSELKRMSDFNAANDTINDIMDEDGENIFETVKIEKQPAFLKEQAGLTGAAKGTATHSVMQHLDMSKAGSYKAVKEQIEKLVEDELLTKAQADAVNAYRIVKFFETELGYRMLKAHKVFRETPFYIEISSTDIYKELPEDIYRNEKIIVQGVIDCYFEEDGELVLLDYKTDYVDSDNIDSIKEKYRKQLQYYSAALERITGMKVKQKLIYLFGNGEIIEY